MTSKRLWAKTDETTYQELLLLLAQIYVKTGKKVKIGEFVELAVRDKLKREQDLLKEKGNLLSI